MRRFVVALAAAALLVLVWVAGPALSAAPFVPRAVDFEQGLDLAGAGAAARGARTYISPVIRAPKRFDLVGLTWRSPVHAGARIRVRDPDGHWSRWTAMGDKHGGRGGSEPVWAGGAEAYQLRLERVPRGLRAHFVNTTGTASAGDRAKMAVRRAAHRVAVALAGAPAQAQAAGATPPIVRREAWGADQCPPRSDPSYGEVQTGFVHHTVSANSYAPEDSAAMVLAICRFHRNANGWSDIGYNFLVDRYGRTFEGRAGGIEEPVVGAQTKGYNGVSTGIANIGTFSSVAQTPRAVHATAELLAWKLSLHAVPVSGPVTVISAGGGGNRTPAGRPATFQRISGHRDANTTECPGRVLYGQLEEIGARAAALAPRFTGGLTLQAVDRTLHYPQAAQLRGRLTGADGAPLGAAAISLQLAGTSGFFTSRQPTTSADGGWSAVLPTSYSSTLRAVARRPDGSVVTSRQLRVGVAPRISVRAARRVGAGRGFTVSGSVRPRRARLMLELQRRSSGGMRTVARMPVKVRSGRYAVRLRLPRAALHRLRVVFKADARNSFGSSARRYVRAVRRR